VSGIGPRRKSREAALQVLFSGDVQQCLDPEGVRESYDEILREFSLPNAARERALELALGVACNLKSIDEAIGSASQKWQVYRLATVDRNILRIGTYELLFEPSTPVEVVIDEAVEIARRFAADSSPAFVNGVLDLVARRRESEVV
jgi:N utilization substance protein B